MTDLDDAARRWAASRREEAAARAEVRAAVIREKAEHGTPDKLLAERAGADRMTVLGWLGKRSRGARRGSRPRGGGVAEPDGLGAEPYEDPP